MLYFIKINSTFNDAIYIEMYVFVLYICIIYLYYIVHRSVRNIVGIEVKDRYLDSS